MIKNDDFDFEDLNETPLGIPCRGHDCNKNTKDEDSSIKMRYDAYNFPTGYYCEDCYENNYPYKRHKYYDYFEAGEYLDNDY